jgi:hypothetical protein
MNDLNNFFKNDHDGLKRVKAIVKKATTCKRPNFKINSIRLLTADGKGRWSQDNFYRSKIVSDVAVIVQVQLGSGISYKLYSPTLYVEGIGSLSVNQPKQESCAAGWLKAYNNEFKDYQDVLHLNSN